MAAEKTASSARHSGAVFAAAALVLLLLPGDGSGSGSGGSGGGGGADKDKIRSVTLPGDVILGELVSLLYILLFWGSFSCDAS